jgi:hypothetical protein
MTSCEAELAFLDDLAEMSGIKVEAKGEEPAASDHATEQKGTQARSMCLLSRLCSSRSLAWSLPSCSPLGACHSAVAANAGVGCQFAPPTSHELSQPSKFRGHVGSEAAAGACTSAQNDGAGPTEKQEPKEEIKPDPDGDKDADDDEDETFELDATQLLNAFKAEDDKPDEPGLDPEGLMKQFLDDMREVDRSNEVHRILSAFKLNPFEQLNLRFTATEQEVKRQYKCDAHPHRRQRPRPLTRCGKQPGKRRPRMRPLATARR